MMLSVFILENLHLRFPAVTNGRSNWKSDLDRGGIRAGNTHIGQLCLLKAPRRYLEVIQTRIHAWKLEFAGCTRSNLPVLFS